jgi:hypothetical protein
MDNISKKPMESFRSFRTCGRSWSNPTATPEMQDVPEAEIESIEAGIDADFAATPLPADGLFRAYWALCATAECSYLSRILSLAPSWFYDDALYEQSGTVAILDRYKFVLRHAFDLSRSRLPASDESRSASGLADTEHASAKSLLDKANEYALANKLFSGWKGGINRVVRDAPSSPIKFYQDPANIPYLALDIFRNDPDDHLNVIPFMMALLASGQNKAKNPALPILGPEMKRIISSVKIDGRVLKYRAITDWARTLRSSLELGPFVIPPEWQFPWGTPSDAKSFFAGLFARCLYHLVAVAFRTLKPGADKLRLDHICLRIPREQLIDDIERIGELERTKIIPIVDALTLGGKMRTPDPALQPLIPVGFGQLALPCTFIASCNYERNLLSLHARVEQEHFDGQSNAFERRMTERIAPKITPPVVCKTNIFCTTSYARQQIDLVLIDHAAGHILLSELHWINRPGDTREVVHKREDTVDKVDQAARQLKAARENLDSFLRALGIANDKAWTVDAIVVVEGFGGVPSPKPAIPVVPKEAFIEGVNRLGRTDLAHSVFRSSAWLPRDGSDFDFSYTEATVCGTKVIAHSISRGPKDYLTQSLPQYISEAIRAATGIGSGQTQGGT